MSKHILSAISAITFVTGTALFYFWKKNNNSQTQIIDRLTIKNILIRLRKRVYSTLREISFIVNQIRTLEGDLQVRKIGQLFMRDGGININDKGSGEKKLQAIESLVLKQLNIKQKEFQDSCNYYFANDIQIKILLETFRKDLNMALEGVVQIYSGPLPKFQPQKILSIQQQIIKRRMQIIYKKFTEQLATEECLKLESCIQEYLQLQGIVHENEANQKIFISILEHYYRTDYQFRQQFQRLQIEMELFMIDIQNKNKDKIYRGLNHEVQQDNQKEISHKIGIQKSEKL